MNEQTAAARRSFVIDPYTYFDYKHGFGRMSPKGGAATVPTWVGDHFRRLQAYKLLESYYRNAAREWLNADMSYEERSLRREYGDPATIVDQTLASLLGEDMSIVVEAATGPNPDPDATDQQAQLLDWADKEGFDLQVYECETNSVKLGDGVYVLGWNEELGRPKIRVFDPGFYFPVLDPTEVTDQFPSKIHIAWEFKDKDNKSFVRRITWSLEDLYEENATQDLPWNEEPTRKTCYMSDGVWSLDDLQTPKIEDLTDRNGRFTMKDEDLGIDFIPVVHIPCDTMGSEHFGTSVLSKVMQILDDIVSTDTDLQAAASTTGTPPLALSGSSAPKDEQGNILSYGPGSVFETGDGTATVIDTSRALDALLKMKDSLLSRLSINSKTPEALLGRVKPNEVPSGIALSLGFTPHTFLVTRMRRLRRMKYSLLLKMVSRYYWLNGDLVDAFPASLEFGSFLPSDMQQAMELATKGLSMHAISTDTAVRMLVNAGYPIEDAVQEVLKIQAENYEAANKLLEATGDAQVVRDYLGLAGIPPAPEPAPAPPPVL